MIVRVPASSANLGPGFDCLGIAWNLYNEIEYELSDSGLVIEGCDERFQGEDNLTYRAFRRALDYAGVKAPGVTIRFRKTEIPVSRGLGSSAALIAGGVVAADRLCSLGLSDEERLSIATGIEGHPDNVAPALFGGMTVSAMDGERAVTCPCPVSPKLYFTVLIPPFELSTELSRSVLPASYSRPDAVFNLSRTALLLRALETGDAQLLRVGLQDRLHQPYRLPLIAGVEQAKAAAEACGAIGLCISGAGSTLLCIAAEADFSRRFAAKLLETLPGWRVLAVTPDLSGAKIISM